MGCLRNVGISVLALGLASYGCAAGAEPEGTTTTTPPGEEGGTTDQDTEAPPGEDAAPADDTGTPEDSAPALAYPAGPYGKTVGAVMPNVTWEGYRDGTGEWTRISLLDYYDPDGSKGIRAIKLGGAALW